MKNNNHEELQGQKFVAIIGIMATVAIFLLLMLQLNENS